MKRASKPLDVKGIDTLRPRAKTYRVSDGGGLLLEVRPSGAKVWLCRLTVAGKRRDMGLGGYPAVTLKAARDAARKARELAGAGTDPISRRDADAAARRAAREAETTAEREAKVRTFRAVNSPGVRVNSGSSAAKVRAMRSFLVRLAGWRD